jgi:hypothetical protein
VNNLRSSPGREHFLTFNGGAAQLAGESADPDRQIVEQTNSSNPLISQIPIYLDVD